MSRIFGRMDAAGRLRGSQATIAAPTRTAATAVTNPAARRGLRFEWLIIGRAPRAGLGQHDRRRLRAAQQLVQPVEIAVQQRVGLRLILLEKILEYLLNVGLLIRRLEV